MKLPEWNKTQKILIVALAGVMLCVVAVVLVLVTRPAQTATAVDAALNARNSAASAAAGYDDPEENVEEISLIEDTLVSVQNQATVAPDLALTFLPDAEHPLPEDGAVLKLGEPFSIGGTVYSNYPLDSVGVSISCSHNTKSPYPYRKSVSFRNSRVGVYDLGDSNTDKGVSLSELVDFSELRVGVHTMKINVTVKGMRAVEVARCTFYVVGDEWETITESNFPDSYPEALQFFGGDTDRFLYRYQWVNGRYILADPEWEKTYITELPAYPEAMPWRMHVDAVPYFTDAFSYLETSYLRVHGTNGDTGVIKASDLITEYNGCYVSRFTSSLKAISHHTFGTAVDVNASMTPNKNSDDNTALIDDDVKGHLVYNGISEEDGVPYYDFTYDGSYRNDPNGVPETCVNYLLYELGFFRAGFDWAHYYRSTSDAMHFCLSEFVTYKHEDANFGLRKVYEYAPPVTATSLLPRPDDAAVGGTDLVTLATPEP